MLRVFHIGPTAELFGNFSWVKQPSLPSHFSTCLCMRASFYWLQVSGANVHGTKKSRTKPDNQLWARAAGVSSDDESSPYSDESFIKS
jgi:hypothetical protein